MPVEEIEHSTFHYLKRGSGKQTILLLHGNACSKQAFFPLFEKDFPNATLLAPDLPGFGKRNSNNSVFSFQESLNFLDQFIEQLELKDIILAGHSMGANIAMHWAKKNPSLFRHLFLIAPAGFESFKEEEKQKISLSLKNFPTIPLHQTLQFLIPAGFFRKDHPNCLKLIQKLSSDYTHASQQPYLASCTLGIEEMLHYEIFNHRNFPNIPSTVLFGDHDPLIPNQLFHTGVPKTFMMEALKGIKNLKLYLFKDCGHYVQCEAPEKTADILSEVIASIQ
jgi:pimeloyl-ACP methyl ester carboxylesterase